MFESVNTERSDTSSLTLNILMKICVHVCVCAHTLVHISECGHVSLTF